MAGSKRRKGRKKGKKGKKKSKIIPEPLPLHTLTELYEKLDHLVRRLMDCRILARKKRIEAQMMQDEEEKLRRDNAVFKEHINNMLDDVMADLKDISARLTREKEAIQKEIDRIIAEYQKRLTRTLAQIEIEEKRVEELLYQLKEFENLKKMVHELEEKLASLKDEYERIKVEIMIKTTHLRNQYLVMRAELYNYLRQQLANLIAKVRKCILPIVWDHMAKEDRMNRCHRWSFKQVDITNARLLQIRENYLKKIETLEWEKKYYGTEWVFSSLNEQRHKQLMEKIRWKKRLQEIYHQRSLYQPSKKRAVIPVQKTQYKIVTDFQIFLQKKLAAITEAKLRNERHERLKAKNGNVTPPTNHLKDRKDVPLPSIASSFTSLSSWSHSYSSIRSRTDSKRYSDDIEILLLNDHLDQPSRQSRGSLPPASVVSRRTTKGDTTRQSPPMTAEMVEAILSGTEGLYAIEE